jgi:O-acetylserine/cysteine efflux transporter
MVTSLLIEHSQLASLHAAGLTARLAFAYTVLVGAVAGWGLWFWLIARCSMTRLAPFGLLQIVFAVAAGVVFLHERLTPSLVVGAALCIIGVAISQSRSAARPRAPAAPRTPVEPIHG